MASVAALASTVLVAYLAATRRSRAQAQVAEWGPRWLARRVAALLRLLAHLGGVRLKSVAAPYVPPKSDQPQYLLVWHPHGALTFAALFLGSSIALDPAGPVSWFTAVAPILFKMPLLREVLLLLNAREVAGSTMERLMRAGRTVGVQPGGIPEQLRTDHRREVAYFPPNLSFCRLALVHGTPLLPVYIFGENQCYETNSSAQRLARAVHAACGLPAVVPFGRFGLPSLLPRSTDVHVRFGRPVPVGPPTAEPTAAQVRELFGRYVHELRRVFDENARDCLPPEIAARGLAVLHRQRDGRTVRVDVDAASELRSTEAGTDASKRAALGLGDTESSSSEPESPSRPSVDARHAAMTSDSSASLLSERSANTDKRDAPRSAL